MTVEEWREAKAQGFAKYRRSKITHLAGLFLLIWLAKMVLPFFTSRPRMSLLESIIYAVYLLLFSLVAGWVMSAAVWLWNDSRFNKPVGNK
jgi:predicted membrane channel-forming protein YqfA (hemolysin III family)